MTQETRHSGSFLVVTWQAGGGTHPALGLGRLLAARGHGVRFLAPRLLRQQIEAVGCEWRPFPEAAEFDPAAGRAADEQRDYVEETFFGSLLPEALRSDVEGEPPDVVVVDALLASTLSTAQTLRPLVAALVHTLRRFHASHDIFGNWGLAEVNRFRARFSQEPLSEGQTTVFSQLQGLSDLELVAIPSEFDDRPDAQPEVVHMGWIPEAQSRAEFDLPWAPDDQTPLVVVGLSSTYMHQEALLDRILGALHDLPVHVLATTGPDLDPDELDVPPGVELRRYVPHALVLPHASLMVTHAGLGSLMAAFAHGVPCVCVPLGRDQPVNAARAAELGAALALPPDAGSDSIRAAVVEALDSAKLRRAAQTLQADFARYEGGAPGVAALEALR